MNSWYVHFFIVAGALSVWLLNSPVLVLLLHCIHNFDEIKSLSPIYQARLDRSPQNRNKWSFTEKNLNWLKWNWTLDEEYEEKAEEENCPCEELLERKRNLWLSSPQGREGARESADP